VYGSFIGLRLTKSIPTLINRTRLRIKDVCPYFLSVSGTRRSTLLGEKKGPTVVIWESLSEQEKGSWLEEASTMHDWVVWCKSKKGAEEICSCELSGKEIFFNYDETKIERGEEQQERKQKEGTSRAERMIQVMVEARQHQSGND